MLHGSTHHHHVCWNNLRSVERRRDFQLDAHVLLMRMLLLRRLLVLLLMVRCCSSRRSVFVRFIVNQLLGRSLRLVLLLLLLLHVVRQRHVLRFQDLRRFLAMILFQVLLRLMLRRHLLMRLLLLLLLLLRRSSEESFYMLLKMLRRRRWRMRRRNSVHVLHLHVVHGDGTTVGRTTRILLALLISMRFLVDVAVAISLLLLLLLFFEMTFLLQLLVDFEQLRKHLMERDLRQRQQRHREVLSQLGQNPLLLQLLIFRFLLLAKIVRWLLVRDRNVHVRRQKHSSRTESLLLQLHLLLLLLLLLALLMHPLYFVQCLQRSEQSRQPRLLLHGSHLLRHHLRSHRHRRHKSSGTALLLQRNLDEDR